MNDLQLDDLLSYSFLDEKVVDPSDVSLSFPVYNSFKFEEWLAQQVQNFEGDLRRV